MSLIIPAYNEQDVIGKTLDDVGNYLENQQYSSEIIVVDAGSSDETSEIIKEKTHVFRNIKSATVENTGGKGGAIKIGISKSQGENVAFIDADNAASFNQIDKLFEKMKEDYDIVMGSRYIEGGSAGKRSLSRKIISRLGNLIFVIVLGLHYKDTRCPLKLFKGDVARKLFSLQILKGFGFDTEILALAKKFQFKVAEVPVTWQPIGETKGKSKVSPIKDSIKSVLEVFQIKWYIIRGKYNK